MMSDGPDQPEVTSVSASAPDRDSGMLRIGGAFFERIDWVSFGLTAMVALAVYLGTLAPEVTLEYSGTLSTSANYGGVAYPPGFPVWTVYSWLFVKLLPFSNIAWRVAVGSAVASALACGLVALMVSRTGPMLLGATHAFTGRSAREQKLLRGVCGFVAGMALGLSLGVWRMAVLAEIWGLSLFLFALTLCLLMRWMADAEPRRYLYGAVFVFGLLLTSSQELAVAIPALLCLVMLGDPGLGRDLSVPVCVLALTAWALRLFDLLPWLGAYAIGGNGWAAAAFLLVGAGAVFVIIRTRRFGSRWRLAVLCIAALLLGLGGYLYLPLASMTNPPINWGYPRSVDGFLHVVSRGQYEHYRPTHGLGRFVEQLWFMAKAISKGFGWFYLVFSVGPLCFLHRMGRGERNWLLGLVAVFVCVGPLLVAVLNPSEERASVDLLRPYFNALEVVLAVWTGLGLMVAGSVLAKSESNLSI